MMRWWSKCISMAIAKTEVYYTIMEDQDEFIIRFVEPIPVIVIVTIENHFFPGGSWLRQFQSSEILFHNIW